MLFVDGDHMIQQVTAAAFDPAFGNTVLLWLLKWRSRRSGSRVDNLAAVKASQTFRVPLVSTSERQRLQWEAVGSHKIQ
jgi:hypothetical protein